ncbi:MAG: transposase, partial [Methylococcales bacterium]
FSPHPRVAYENKRVDKRGRCMERYPANMIDLTDRFPAEEACLEYLGLVWWPRGYECLRCASKAYWKTERGLFHCRDCGYEGSVTRGTLATFGGQPVYEI